MNSKIDPEIIKSYPKQIRELSDSILTNIVLTGQIPSPTFEEKKRCDFFLNRLTELNCDECTIDAFGNPIGIIRGKSGNAKPPVFLVAHMDTTAGSHVEHNYSVKKDKIEGPGIFDNSTGVGVLLSMPLILEKLKIKTESDIILAAPIQSIGLGNLGGIRNILDNWEGPVRGALCLEGGQLGRINFFSNSMTRGEILCKTEAEDNENGIYGNAIVALTEVINEILKIRIPQKPWTRIIIGKIQGGFKHGIPAPAAKAGYEILSNDDEIVKSIYDTIRNITTSLQYEYNITLKRKVISHIQAAKLKYNHPLVLNAIDILKTLDIEPNSDSSESELSTFLNHNIPAITVGLSTGVTHNSGEGEIEIEPLYKGIAQVIALVQSIDNGACDEQRVD